MSFLRKISFHPFFIKLFHWEYWSFHVVYAPVYIYWIWLCIRARSFFFFNTANPNIKNGGFLLESKKEIYDSMPSAFYPATLFFNTGIKEGELLNTLKLAALQFPLIAKPDIGGRGRGVKKLETFPDVIEYARSSRVDFLVQEFVPYENEVGIFYYRYPNNDKGHISGIVEKEFLTVEGDGQSTMEQLLKKDKRFILQLPALKKAYGDTLKLVVEKNAKVLLVPYGNHARGAKFIDRSDLIDEKLEATIDAICKKIPQFYFGRLDIRYNNWEELKEGKNFSIIEANGAGSEPTHMYDPRHSVFFAWKEIMRHWNILWKISRLNHRHHKIAYMPFSAGLQMFRENAQYEKLVLAETNQTV